MRVCPGAMDLTERAHSFRMGAVVIAAWTPVDLVVCGRFDGLIIAVQVFWVAFCAVAAWLTPRACRAARPLACAVGAVSAVCLAVLVWRLGGIGSFWLVWLFALPFIATLVLPDDPIVVLVTGAMALLACVALLVIGGADVARWMFWMAAVCSAIAFALYGSVRFMRQRQAELSAERERARVSRALEESEQRRREAERWAELERLAMVGRLAAQVAHQVNNPLTAVKHNLEYMRSHSQGEVAQAALESIEAARHIEYVVQGLRDGSFKVSPAGERRCDVAAVLVEAKRLTRLTWHGVAELTIDAEAGLPPAAIDQVRLTQVVINLVVNACDALLESPKEGNGRVHLTASRGGDENVQICVDDDGPGLSDSLLGTIFQPFFSTKPQGLGTGLGLALCHTYLDQVGGEIAASRSPWAGARFTLTIPFVAAGAGDSDRMDERAA